MFKKIKINAEMKVGDIIFIHIPFPPFAKISTTTMSWTNHVGIVSRIEGGEVWIAESKLPIVYEGKLNKFLLKAYKREYRIYRVSGYEQSMNKKLLESINKRIGIKYDLGFDLDSKKTYCSKFVREVYKEVLDIDLGEVENFKTLLTKNKKMSLIFWKIWYLFNIPWERKTVSPASIMLDKKLTLIN